MLVSASTDSVLIFFCTSSLLSSPPSTVLLFGVELALALNSIGLTASPVILLDVPCGVGGDSNLPDLLIIGADILGMEFNFSVVIPSSLFSVFKANAWSSGSESSGALVRPDGLWQPGKLFRQWLTLCSMKRTISLSGKDTRQLPHITKSNGDEFCDVSAVEETDKRERFSLSTCFLFFFFL